MHHLSPYTSAFSNMELRSGIYKGLHGVLPQQARPQFEEGVNLLFSRWTALCLAIDNEWGGRNSREKAEHIYNDVLHWFYNHKGAALQVAAVAETLPHKAPLLRFFA